MEFMKNCNHNGRCCKRLRALGRFESCLGTTLKHASGNCGESIKGVGEGALKFLGGCVGDLLQA